LYSDGIAFAIKPIMFLTRPADTRAYFDEEGHPMSQLAVQTLWPQMAGDGVDPKEKSKPNLHFVDRVTAQERVRDFHRMPHLAKEDAAIERVAWAIVLGLLCTAIRLAGVL
jgi:hypothetical protein